MAGTFEPLLPLTVCQVSSDVAVVVEAESSYNLYAQITQYLGIATVIVFRVLLLWVCFALLHTLDHRFGPALNLSSDISPTRREGLVANHGRTCTSVISSSSTGQTSESQPTSTAAHQTNDPRTECHKHG